MKDLRFPALSLMAKVPLVECSPTSRSATFFDVAAASDIAGEEAAFPPCRFGPAEQGYQAPGHDMS